MSKFKRLNGVNVDDLFAYFLLIDCYQWDLFIPSNGGHYMPDYNEQDWYKVAPMIKKDLKLRDMTIVDGKAYSYPYLWEFLRETWKGMSTAEMYEVAELVCERWGDFQIGNKA